MHRRIHPAMDQVQAATPKPVLNGALTQPGAHQRTVVEHAMGARQRRNDITRLTLLTYINVNVSRVAHGPSVAGAL